MLQFVRPIQCFLIFCFVFFLISFCFVNSDLKRKKKGQGQWVIQDYFNIYEKKEVIFVTQNLSWTGWSKGKNKAHSHKRSHADMYHIPLCLRNVLICQGSRPPLTSHDLKEKSRARLLRQEAAGLQHRKAPSSPQEVELPYEFGHVRKMELDFWSRAGLKDILHFRFSVCL